MDLKLVNGVEQYCTLTDSHQPINIDQRKWIKTIYMAKKLNQLLSDDLY